MHRWNGDPVPSGLRIALIANDALGNFVVATPLAQMLRREFAPSQLDYFGGSRTRELQDASDLYDHTYCLFGEAEGEVDQLANEAYDWVINLEASPVAMDFAARLGRDSVVTGPVDGLAFEGTPQGRLWEDRNWIASDLVDRYPFLETGFIGEIFCRLCYLKGPIPPYRVPTAPHGLSEVPDVLMATSASLESKLWPAEHWLAVADQLAGQGHSLGLLGAAPKPGGTSWLGSEMEEALANHAGVKDLRGKLRLPQVAGVLGECKLVLTLDNGILHLACASSTPIVGLFRPGIHRLWAPPRRGLEVLIPTNEGEAVRDLSVEAVVAACKVALGDDHSGT